MSRYNRARQVPVQANQLSWYLLHQPAGAPHFRPSSRIADSPR
ncbi:hypothetical protein DM77_3133 [Burkholderia mallei]|nr:hypothetical protein DM77_3133 [Burkholderia mallei]